MDPPLSLLFEESGTILRLEAAADGAPRLRLTMAANQTGPERVVDFAPVAAPEAESG